MNRMFLAALLAVGISGGLTSSSLMAADHAATTQPATKDAEKWVCPMKCEGSTSDKPGKCPVCGMKLTKAKHADKKQGQADEKHGKDDAAKDEHKP